MERLTKKEEKVIKAALQGLYLLELPGGNWMIPEGEDLDTSACKNLAKKGYIDLLMGISAYTLWMLTDKALDYKFVPTG